MILVMVGDAPEAEGLDVVVLSVFNMMFGVFSTAVRFEFLSAGDDVASISSEVDCESWLALYAAKAFR